MGEGLVRVVVLVLVRVVMVVVVVLVRVVMVMVVMRVPAQHPATAQVWQGPAHTNSGSARPPASQIRETGNRPTLI